MSDDRRFSGDEFWGSGGEAKPSFNVAVICDSPSAAIRAISVFTGLAWQFDNAFDVHCHLWRFDALELPEVMEEAVRTGQAADLLLVSAHGDADLSGAAKAWLCLCIAEKNPGWAALVGLLESRGRSSDIPSPSPRQFLQNAADCSLMDFFLLELDFPGPRGTDG